MSRCDMEFQLRHILAIFCAPLAFPTLFIAITQVFRINFAETPSSMNILFEKYFWIDFAIYLATYPLLIILIALIYFLTLISRKLYGIYFIIISVMLSFLTQYLVFADETLDLNIAFLGTYELTAVAFVLIAGLPWLRPVALPKRET